jgi:hypothetical protein
LSLLNTLILCNLSRWSHALQKFFTYEKANLEATKKYTLALGKFELIIQLSRLIHVLSESLHGRERKLCEKFLSFEPPPAEVGL